MHNRAVLVAAGLQVNRTSQQRIELGAQHLHVIHAVEQWNHRARVLGGNGAQSVGEMRLFDRNKREVYRLF